MKRKRDIISVIVIILLVGLIFLGYQLAQKENCTEKKPIEVLYGSVGVEIEFVENDWI